MTVKGRILLLFECSFQEQKNEDSSSLQVLAVPKRFSVSYASGKLWTSLDECEQENY